MIVWWITYPRILGETVIFFIYFLSCHKSEFPVILAARGRGSGVPQRRAVVSGCAAM